MVRTLANFKFILFIYQIMPKEVYDALLKRMKRSLKPAATILIVSIQPFGSRITKHRGALDFCQSFINDEKKSLR